MGSHESDRDAVQSHGTRAAVTVDNTDKVRNGEIMTAGQDEVDEYETDGESDITDDDELALL